jgi:hypothetical protein
LKILIIEPSLDGAKESGHTRQGIRFLLDYILVQRKHVDVNLCIFGGSNFVINKEVKVTDLFYRLRAVREPGRFMLKFINRIIMKFNSKFSKSFLFDSLSFLIWRNIKESSIIVYQSIEVDQIPNPRVFKPNQVVKMRVIGKPQKQFDKLFINALNSYHARLGKNFHFACENIKVLNWVQSQTKIKAFHVPWFSLYETSNSKSVNLDQSSPIKVFFPGEQRDSKGFVFIPQIINNFNNSNQSNSANFMLQEINDMYINSSLIMNELRSLINCVILSQNLSKIDYFYNLSISNVVVLPYLDKGYEWTASGVMADAIKFGIPVIAPSGSAAGYEISKFNLGFTFDHLTEISDLIFKANDPNFKKDFFKSVEIYKRNSKSNFIGWLHF